MMVVLCLDYPVVYSSPSGLYSLMTVRLGGLHSTRPFHHPCLPQGKIHVIQESRVKETQQSINVQLQAKAKTLMLSVVNLRFVVCAFTTGAKMVKLCRCTWQGVSCHTTDHRHTSAKGVDRTVNDHITSRLHV